MSPDGVVFDVEEDLLRAAGLCRRQAMLKAFLKHSSEKNNFERFICDCPKKILLDQAAWSYNKT